MMYIHHSWEKRNRSSFIANRTLTDSQDNQKTQQCYQLQPGGVPHVDCNAYHTYSSTDPTYIHLDPTGILATLRNQEFMPLPALVVTVTLPKLYRKKGNRDIYLVEAASIRLRKYERVISDHCFGKRFRRHGKRLETIGVVEGRYTNPHIHLVVEAHPNLSPSILKHLWKDFVSPRSSLNASRVKKVTKMGDRARIAEYLTKEVRWGEIETEPYFFGPKITSTKNKRGSHAKA